MAWGSLSNYVTLPPPQKVGAVASAAVAQPDLSFLTDPNNPYVRQKLFEYLGSLPASGGGGGGGYSGGGGGGYDGGGAAAAPAGPILEQSPEWVAYISALGLQKGQFAADIQRQREMAGAAAGFQRDQLKPQYDQQRRGIAGNAESRGMSRSGEYQRNLSTSRAAENKAYGGIYMGLQNSLSNLESSLAQKNLELDAQRSQQYASMIAQGYKPGIDYNALGAYLKSQGG